MLLTIATEAVDGRLVEDGKDIDNGLEVEGGGFVDEEEARIILFESIASTSDRLSSEKSDHFRALCA